MVALIPIEMTQNIAIYSLQGSNSKLEDMPDPSSTKEQSIPSIELCGLNPIWYVITIVIIGGIATAIAGVEVARDDREALHADFLSSAHSRAMAIADSFYSYVPEISVIRRGIEGSFPAGVPLPVRMEGAESQANHLMGTSRDHLTAIGLAVEIDAVHQDIILANLRAAYPNYADLDRGFKAITSKGFVFYDDALTNATIGPRMNVFTTIGGFSLTSLSLGSDASASELRSRVINNAVLSSSNVISEPIALNSATGPKRGVYVTAPMFSSIGPIIANGPVVIPIGINVSDYAGDVAPGIMRTMPRMHAGLRFELNAPHSHLGQMQWLPIMLVWKQLRMEQGNTPSRHAPADVLAGIFCEETLLLCCISVRLQGMQSLLAINTRYWPSILKMLQMLLKAESRSRSALKVRQLLCPPLNVCMPLLQQQPIFQTWTSMKDGLMNRQPCSHW